MGFALKAGRSVGGINLNCQPTLDDSSGQHRPLVAGGADLSRIKLQTAIVSEAHRNLRFHLATVYISY